MPTTAGVFGIARTTGRSGARPSIVALWNNFHALAAKLNVPEPAEPLYLLKAPSSVTAPGAVIKPPACYGGKTTYEGELGIVIGRTCARAWGRSLRAA